jgi:hypothetical protein
MPQVLAASASKFEILMAAARSGDVIVANVFAALRNGEISESECRAVITTFERARVPAWQRFLVSSSSSS